MISMNYGSSTGSWKWWRWVRFDLTPMIKDIYITSNLNPHTKFTSSNRSTEFKDIRVFPTGGSPPPAESMLIPPHFCFSFILFGHTCHANFDFKWCSVFTESYFSFVFSLLLSRFPPPGKKVPSKISDPPKWGEFPPTPIHLSLLITETIPISTSQAVQWNGTSCCEFDGKSMETEITTWSESPNGRKGIVQQILASEEINKSKGTELWESQSEIWVGKLTIWVRLFEKLQQSSPDLSVPQQKSPKTNALADGSIERTSSMLDETESKIVFKDK